MAVLPLEGLTVLEFSHTVMGPSCGVVLADLGADVKIEPAPNGDHTTACAASPAASSAISIATSAASAWI